MTDKKKQPSIDKLIEEIEGIVNWFESDQVDLDLALTKYEEALAKLKQVQRQLETTKLKVKHINQKFDV